MAAMDTFTKHKNDFLSKIDKSKKGSIDKPIRKLVDSINKLENYYTTSSCSGRTVLLHKTSSNKKNKTEWLFSSHSKITKIQLTKSLENLPKDGEVWLLSEAPIMHIACATLDYALSLMRTANDAGFKRAAIISHKENKTTVEIIGNNRIEMPITSKGKILVSEAAFSFLIKDANQKMKDSHKRLGKLQETAINRLTQ